MKKGIVCCLLLLATIYTCGSFAGENTVETRAYTTARCDAGDLSFDGRIDDRAWEVVEWAGDFIQRNPYEGAQPSQETTFKILYDDDNLYVAFRAYDTEPYEIASITAPRDWFPGDWVEINIDSYLDRRTAFSFTLSVSGVRGDEFISNDGSGWDTNWNPVWEGKTSIDEVGWTAEMKIPLNQLRFGSRDEHVWGIQVTRRIFRKEERSCWQFIPQDAPGWVSNFGELHGISGIEPKRHIELLPYIMGKVERFEREEGNPFAAGGSSAHGIGLDGKIGISTDLILDFTINPDFGQVEADPSEVNLTEFETYFSEKRPFFIEGSSILDYQLTPAITGGDFVMDNLFYSRRIGRRPGHYPDEYDYIDMPGNSMIIGAFKLSGKTEKGLSIGIMESVTAEEQAELEVDGERDKITVEPQASYFAGRIIQDYNRGDSYAGGMITAVNRGIDDDHLRYMHTSAYAGGLDLFHRWGERAYYVLARTAFSNVSGDEEAILETQTASARYFQRPDNDHASVDSTRTSLSGHSGTIQFGKSSNGRFRFETGVSWRSPGFELNDMGYLYKADRINQFTWAGYWVENPFSIFRRFSVNANQWCNWDFGGVNTSNAVNVNMHATFHNNANCSGRVTRGLECISNDILRGGPSARRPGDLTGNIHFNSDHRKRLSFGCGSDVGIGGDDDNRWNGYWCNLNIRPNNQLRVSIHPSYGAYRQNLEYISIEDFDGSDRYIFAQLKQRTASLKIRLDYCITPNFSIRYYGSPFVSAGKYSRFKRITDPMARRYEDRFMPFGEKEIYYDSDDMQYKIDEDADGTVDYYVYDPDFNFREFNSTLVIRWEFSPGSSLYLVWSQVRTGCDPSGEFSWRSDASDLFGIHPHDILLLKINHWFSL